MAAIAQTAAAEIRSLEVSADAGLQPGSSLGVKLIGTPRAQATVRIRGIRAGIPMREGSPGVYVGSYTLKRADRVANNSEVRATLRRANRTEVATYELSETMAAPQVVAAPAPVPAPAPPVRVPEPRIERLGISPVDRIEPGTDIRFALEGTPGGAVVVDLPGVEGNVRLREARPGFYEGSYTLRRADNFNPNRPVVATMRIGDRVSTTNVPFPSTAQPAAAVDNRPPNVLNLVPREGETVASGPATQISANFDDGGGSGVDPASVQIIVSGRNVTREAQINAQSFTFRGALPPGRQVVDVTARDRAGNVVRRSWSFDVAAAVVAPVNVGVQVLNHGNNGQVGAGPTLIEARTAPRASVAVTVQAVAPAGGILNISQTIFQQTLQADGEGNFSFTFVPQFPIPSSRYDILMVSSRGNASQETRLSLFQR